MRERRWSSRGIATSAEPPSTTWRWASAAPRAPRAISSPSASSPAGSPRSASARRSRSTRGIPKPRGRRTAGPTSSWGRKQMKGKRLAPLLCLALRGAAAGGCAVADTGAFVRLQEDMESLKREVAAGRKSPAPGPPSATGAGRNDLTSFQTTLADLASDNDRIKSDLLAVTTRADETKLEMQKEASRLNGITTEQGQAIQQMRGKIAKPQEIEKRVAALEEKAGKGAARAGAAPQVSGGNFKTPGGV